MWLLLHGFTGSPRAWDDVLRHAELRRAPLVPTLTGHGKDWRDVSSSSFEDELRRLAALAARLEPPRLVAGYSMGARLALGLILGHPSLFAGAVLIGVHPGLSDSSAREERRALDRDRARRLRDDGLEAFVSEWERLPLFETQQSLPRALVDRQRAIRMSHEADGLAHALEVLGLAEMPDYGPALRRSSTPTIVMAGDRDSKFRDVAAALGARHPSLEPRIIEGAGHNLLVEAPRAVAEALLAAEEAARR